MSFGYKGLGKNRRKVDLCSVRVSINYVAVNTAKLL